METTCSRRTLELAAFATLTLVIASQIEATQKPTIGLEGVEEHLRFLSSDELGGRGNGTRGLSRAANYIAEQFRELGLEPVGDRR